MSEQLMASVSLVIVGAIIVASVAFYRFASEPVLSKRLHIPGIPVWLDSILAWLSFRSKEQSSLFPPPRANTTLMKFWLFRLLYTFSFTALYLSIIFVSDLDKELITIISLFIYEGGDSEKTAEKIVNLQDFGPVTLAFIIVWAPIIPPIRELELRIRRFLYDGALIDSQRIFESSRLKRAEPFHGEDEFVEGEKKPGAARQKVWDRLIPDGFDARDLVYTPGPAKTQSLWMKVSLLDIHISNWEAMNKYKTAFKVLTELDGKDRTVKIVHKNYETLKGDAVTCFKCLREEPELQETKDREAKFRGDCKALLDQTYNLLARISLKSHYSEDDRIECMREIGLKLKPIRAAPTPDANELIALGAIVAIFIGLPLTLITGDLIKTSAVVFAMFSAVLTPIFFAHMYPGFAFRRGRSNAPSVAFPFVSGVVSGVIGFAVIFIFFSNFNIEQLTKDLKGSGRYLWCVFLFVLAGLTAFRMRAGTYPSEKERPNLSWYQLQGNLRDAIIFAGTIAVLVLALFGKSSFDAWGGEDFVRMASRLVLPPPFAFVIGFFVPTWYRGRQAAEQAERRAAEQAADS